MRKEDLNMENAKQAVALAMQINIDKDDFFTEQQEKTAVDIVKILCEAGLTIHEASETLGICKMAILCCKLQG